MFRVSNIKDNSGNFFYERNGSIDIWDISQLLGLADRQIAPIRLTTRNIDHIVKSHPEILKHTNDVFSFVDEIFKNAKILRKGRGMVMWVVYAKDNLDVASCIKLMLHETGDYYNVDNAGFYRKTKWKDFEKILAELSEPTLLHAVSNPNKPNNHKNNGCGKINANGLKQKQK